MRKGQRRRRERRGREGERKGRMKRGEGEDEKRGRGAKWMRREMDEEERVVGVANSVDFTTKYARW